MAFFKKKQNEDRKKYNSSANGDVDVNEVMRKYDRESNTRIWEGAPKIAIRCILALFSVFCIYVTLFSNMLEQARLSSFVGLLIVMGYLNYPASKKRVRVNSMPWYDWILMILGAGAFFYYSFNAMAMVKLSYGGIAKSPLLIILAIIGIIALVELCRRCVGIPILCVAAFFVLYAFIGKGLSLKRVSYELFYSANGILTTPINVCSKYIVVFIIFGAFLERTGIAEYFINLANKLFGSAAGGPAKVAVVSSALCGMVSGSSVGNTVTTGSITIPMMKDNGYKPEFAGAVEAAASTGGQIMPPIMGAAAFLMADYVGIPYSNIIVKAILPAILYFLGIFIAVHLEAKKLGLKGISKDYLPKMAALIKRSYLLIPLILLVWLVSSGARTMAFSAAVSILAAIVVCFISKENRQGGKGIVKTLGKFVEALEAGAKSSMSVGVACGVAGIITGCITVTGLASVLINAIVQMAAGKPFIALFFTMLCCIVLGMGVPTTANYCIMASTCAPILTTIGIDPIAAHFFVFYFGIVADITPPVALAAYAGSARAKANPMKTGVNATRLAIAAFIVPYVFALNPAMLFIDTGVWEVVQITITAVVGIFGVAAGLSGFLAKPLHWALRLVIIAGGLLLIIPGSITDVIGLAVIVLVFLFQTFIVKKNVAA